MENAQRFSDERKSTDPCGHGSVTFADSSFMLFSPKLDGKRHENDKSRDGAVSIATMSLRRLRAAIQNNQVSFPSQIPAFERQARSDIQWRLVELYFVQNWTCVALGRRYGVAMEWVRRLISNWVQRAIVLGYLQEIPLAAPLVDADSRADETSTAERMPISPAPMPEPRRHLTAASSRL
jgi:hypothetical protein